MNLNRPSVLGSTGLGLLSYLCVSEPRLHLGFPLWGGEAFTGAELINQATSAFSWVSSSILCGIPGRRDSGTELPPRELVR